MGGGEERRWGRGDEVRGRRTGEEEKEWSKAVMTKDIQTQM